jgi:hypothetical protein
MGIVMVKKSSTGSPATEALAVETAAVEVEVEIEEIMCLEEENATSQCVCIARKRGDE